MKKGYVDAPEGQIHYRADGSGQNLLLLHQAPMSSEEYEAMMPLLARHCRVIAPDFPGHGNSDDPPREYDIEDYARSMAGFLNVLKIGRTNIFGHHTGAIVAVELATKYPHLVSGLILSGCPVLDPEAWRQRLKRPSFRDMPLDPDGELVKHIWSNYHTLSGHPDPRQWLGPFLLGLASRRRPYDAHHAVGRYLIGPRLPLITQRTLLVSGTRDMFYNDLESTRGMIPGATTAVVPDGGVFGIREQPEAFAHVIQQFLEEESR